MAKYTQADLRRLFERYRRDSVLFVSELRVPGLPPKKTLGECWAEWQQEAFEQMAPCFLAVADGEAPPLRGVWLERTKGCSKDSDVGLLLLWLLVFSPRPLLCELGADKREQARETWKAMRAVVRLNPWISAMRDRAPVFERSKVFTARVTCDFLTASDTGAHGSRPDLTVCNELSHVTSEDFMATMMDNADKITTNFAIIATNAGQKFTWQWHWRESMRTNPRWWFQKVDKPAPWIDPAKMEDARLRNLPARFNRLWRGIWSTGEGDAIAPALIEAAFTQADPMSPEEAAEDGWSCIMAIDVGIKHDHGAIVILATRPKSGRIRLAYCQSFIPPKGGSVNMGDFRKSVERWYKAYNCLAAFYDTYEMRYMATQLRADGYAMVEVSLSSINARTECATAFFEVFQNQLIDLYREPLLEKDLYKISIQEDVRGKRQLVARSDEDGHADRAMAAALALPEMLNLAVNAPPPLPETVNNERIIA